MRRSSAQRSSRNAPTHPVSVPSPEGPSPGAGSPTRITVILPCYNDGALLVKAIDSIEESEPIELIVVDDSSTDAETAEILERLVAEGTNVVFRGERQGPGASRNTGLHSARTPYVFPLDSDDLAVPGALAAMADRLDANPEAAVCFGDYLEFGTHELVRAVPTWLDPFRLAHVNEYPVSSLFRRSVLVSVGGWRSFSAYEDWDLWLALVEHGYGGVHLGPGKLVYRRRLHGERMLTAGKRMHRELYRQIRNDHPGVFRDIGRLRRESDLPLHRKLLYPIVYGSRPRFAFEGRIKHWLDSRGIWTLRR
jgi:glycosyltransferase involved in cell wall biosynthesis